MQQTYSSILNHLPDHARVWLYQSKRWIKPHEAEEIKSKANAFIRDWSAHGKALNAGFEVIDNCFLVLSVDEQVAMATGCSIDKSVSLFHEIDQEYQLELFDRFNVAFVNKEGNKSLSNLNDLAKLQANQEVSGDSLVFDNLVNKLGDLRTNWIKPFKDSWHQRFLD